MPACSNVTPATWSIRQADDCRDTAGPARSMRRTLIAPSGLSRCDADPSQNRGDRRACAIRQTVGEFSRWAHCSWTPVLWRVVPRQVRWWIAIWTAKPTSWGVRSLTTSEAVRWQWAVRVQRGKLERGSKYHCAYVTIGSGAGILSYYGGPTDVVNSTISGNTGAGTVAVFPARGDSGAVRPRSARTAGSWRLIPTPLIWCPATRMGT